MLQMLTALELFITGRLHPDEDGATAVEYGHMVALIAVVIIAAVRLVGTNLRAVFDAIGAALGGV